MQSIFIYSHIQDYHVIFIQKMMGSDGSFVYDLDSLLSFPCNFDLYCAKTVCDDDSLPPDYQRYVCKTILLSLSIFSYYENTYILFKGSLEWYLQQSFSRNSLRIGGT